MFEKVIVMFADHLLLLKHFYICAQQCEASCNTAFIWDTLSDGICFLFRYF